MNQFSIRDIENLCGIRAHTLRTWESRYGLFVAKRKHSKHRIYDDNDLKILLRISFLYHHGHKISSIAHMSETEIEEAVNKTIVTEENYDLFIHQLIEASLDLQKEKLDRIINNILIRTGMDKAIQHVFYPFLQRIGLLWMTNHLIPAQEHFCSHIICKKIMLTTDGLELPAMEGPRYLVFAPAGEHHELPLLSANYYLRHYGNRTVYLGKDIPLETLLYYLEHQPCEYLFVHILTLLRQEEMKAYLKVLSTLFKGKNVYLSGPYVQELLPDDERFVLLRSIDDLVKVAAGHG